MFQNEARLFLPNQGYRLGQHGHKSFYLQNIGFNRMQIIFHNAVSENLFGAVGSSSDVRAGNFSDICSAISTLTAEIKPSDDSSLHSSATHSAKAPAVKCREL